MKKLLIIAGIIIIIIAFVNMPQKGTFEELVLDKYADIAVAKEFDTIQIQKMSDKNTIYKADNNINKINELLSKFNELNLAEYNKRIPKNNKWTYNIFLKNNNTHEYLAISTMGNNYIWIHINTISITENKKDKITETKYVETDQQYKITNKNIDFNYLNDLYNSLSNVDNSAKTTCPKSFGFSLI